MGAGDPRTDRDKIVGIVQADDMDPIPVQGIDSTVNVVNQDPISVENEYNLNYLNKDIDTNLSSGGDETVEFVPPTDKVWIIRHLEFFAPLENDATVGNHKFWVYMLDSGGAANDPKCYAESDYQETVGFRYGTPFGNDHHNPSNEMAFRDTIIGTFLTENYPLVITYSNSLDVTQENGRNYRLWYQEVPKTV